jgi:hypothetical protein
LSRIIFQFVDGNMIISRTLHGLEEPAQGNGVCERRRPVLRWLDSNETRTRNVDEASQRISGQSA